MWRSVLILILGLQAPPANADEPPTLPMTALDDMLASAAPHAEVKVPAGVYAGHLRIRRPVTLDGQGTAVLDGGGKGTVVEISSPNVTLRGFTVRASGSGVATEPAAIRAVTGPVTIERNRIEDALFGIDLREAPNSVIRNNTIFGKDLEPGRRGDGIRLWWSHECSIEGNHVAGSRDMVFWYSENLRVSRNRVSGSRYGLHFMYSHDTELAANELSENSVGIYLMYSHRIRLVRNTTLNNRGASGYGVGLKDCDDIVLVDNALLANRVGLYVDNSPSSVDARGVVESNLIAFNEIGLLATPNTHDNVFTGNVLRENGEQAASHGRGTLEQNLFSREGVGNFWSDYAGFDRDGDGVGDLPHEARSLFHSLLAQEPNLRVFLHSPAQQAVEFTARAMPELRPPPTLVDVAPLTRPPALGTLATEPRSSRARMVGTGAALLSLPLLCLLTLGRRRSLGASLGGVSA